MTRPADPTEPEGPTLDPAVLTSLRDALSDDALVAEIIETFQSDTPGQIATLVAAESRGDGPTVTATAHLIKGSALTLGAVRLVRLCAALEASPSSSAELVSAVAAEFGRLTLSLSDRLRELSPQG